MAFDPWFVLRWAALAACLVYAWRRRSLTVWILVAILVGAEIGHDWPEFGRSLRVLGQIFLKLIKTIVAPLLFATLVVGIAGHSSLRQVGRMGLKAVVYFTAVTTVALLLGWAAISISQAGVGMNMAAADADTSLAPAQPQTAADVILNIFPENIARSVAEGQVLQIVVFSVIFAVALAMVRDDRRQPMLRFCESLADTMFMFTNLVMYLAPIGVAGAMAYTIGQMGLSVFGNLLQLLVTVYVGLVVLVAVVFVPIAVLARVPLRRFLAAAAEPVSIAFATASSEAALPRAMEAMERLGTPRQIVAFVLPTGFTFNLAGTTLYLPLAAIFVAQAAGVEMSLGQQMIMLLTLMVTSKGVAGVPRASLVVLLATLASFDLPVEPVFIILGIDALMDMARTAVNVLGNCLAAVVIARWEGEFVDHPAEVPTPVA